MKRTWVFNGLAMVATMLGTVALLAGCSEQGGGTSDLPDSIGKVMTPEESRASLEKLNQLKGSGYKGAPGVPYREKR